MYSGIGIIVIVIALVAVGMIQGVVLPRNATVLKINDRSFNLDYFTKFLEQMAANSPDQSLATLAPQVMQQMQTVELLRQGAEQRGVTVSADNITGELANRGLPDTAVLRDLVRYELLSKKMKDTYFADQVQDPAPQADVQGLLLEDAMVAAEVRPLVMAADNITGVVQQYGLNYYSQNPPYGDFGWHPENILNKYLGSQIPLDYAFGAQAGDVSQPLTDNTTSKKLGYWVLKVNALNLPEATGNATAPVTANVTGVLLGSRAEALAIKARLDAGEDIAPIAAENPNYSLSQQHGGQLGLLSKPAEGSPNPAISPAVDAVIFSPDTPLGVWLDPIQDDSLYTKGGAWIIKVVDTSPSRALSEDDRTILINDGYNTWVQDLPNDPSFTIDQSLTPEQQTQAIQQAAKDLQRSG